MLKKLTILLLSALLIAFTINRLYERFFSPGNVFFSQCLEKSREWETSVRSHGKPCYVFAGGSEVRMGIEPEVMWNQHGIAAINAGAQAGNGYYCNVQTALDFLIPGDTLVLACRPLNFAVTEDFSHSGVNFIFQHQGFEAFSDGIVPLNADNATFLLCGNSSFYCMHLMRSLTRPECIYRYSSPRYAGISESGRVEVFLTNVQTRNINQEGDVILPPIEGWSQFLDKVKLACNHKKVNLLIYIAQSHSSASTRKANAYLALHFVKMGIPVLRDPELGASENALNFSDTSLHLSPEYGKKFSSLLAELIKNRTYWTEAELTDIINERSCTD